MRAQTAREQAVTIRNLHDGIFAATEHVNSAGEAIAPHLQVVFRVAHDRRLARGARRRMHAHAFGTRHGEQAERIGVAHILLHGKGELLDVFERFDMVRIDASLVKALLIERDVLIAANGNVAQTLELKFLELRVVHALDFFLIVLRHREVLPCGEPRDFTTGERVGRPTQKVVTITLAH